MESGEEQHFLRGKPAFRAQTLFQAPQTGNALSPIYVFHSVLRKHERRKAGMRVHGRVSDNTHTKHTKQRHAGGIIMDKWAKTSQSCDSPALPLCLLTVMNLFHEEAATRRWDKRGSSSVWNPLHWHLPPPLKLALRGLTTPVTRGIWKEGWEVTLSYSPSLFLSAGRS